MIKDDVFWMNTDDVFDRITDRVSMTFSNQSDAAEYFVYERDIFFKRDVNGFDNFYRDCCDDLDRAYWSWFHEKVARNEWEDGERILCVSVNLHRNSMSLPLENSKPIRLLSGR